MTDAAPSPSPGAPAGSPFCLVVVGAGPTCTYVVERLAAAFLGAYGTAHLDLHVFEATGFFGAGAVHSPAQPDSSLLNRIAGQVAFAADESNTEAEFLLPAELRPTLHEWCASRYAETGDPQFDLGPEDWPRRNVHGMALCDMFDRYVGLLRSVPGVRVFLHACAVTDVMPHDGRYAVKASDPDSRPVLADHILLLTGHSHNRAADDSLEHRLETFAATSGRAVYLPYAYPLESRVPAAATGPDRVVGCAGMGLTAIDVILYLTEGRGGAFVRDPTSRCLVYLPTGREPQKIIGFSRCGTFTTARPHNAKEADPARLEHCGRFLTETSVDRLRRSVGRPTVLEQIGTRRQLDFERHLFPLVLLEMTFVYYKTLFGPAFGESLCEGVRDRLEDFLDGRFDPGLTPDESARLLCAPAAAFAESARGVVKDFLAGRALDDVRGRQPALLDVAELLRCYLETVLGPAFTRAVAGKWPDGYRLRDAARAWVSPWAHPLDPDAHVFDWDAIRDPLEGQAYSHPSDYTRALLEFMDRDHLDAAQDNLRNPTKAACDGVWRDLRTVLGYAIDFGGLTPGSHRRFIDDYLRHHNRLANGACLGAMEKMLSLIRCDLLDVSTGPGARVSIDESAQCFRVVGPATGADHHIDCLIQAKIHPANVALDQSPLLAGLVERGLVQVWRNVSADGQWYEPGGVHVTKDFRPVGVDGSVTPGLTFLGAPTEGVLFFQIGAARPRRNHHVLNDVIRWTTGFRQEFEQSGRFRRRASPCGRVVEARHAHTLHGPAVTAVILAAGRNARMGAEVGPKSLLPLWEEGADLPWQTFLSRQIALLEHHGVSAIVVANEENAPQFRSSVVGSRARVVVNLRPPEECGSAASLLAAIDQGGPFAGGLLVLDADIVYESRILDRVLTPRRTSCLFTSAAVAEDNEEVRVYGVSPREPRFIGKALPTALTAPFQCLGESLGMIFVAHDNISLVAGVAKRLGAPTGRRAEHEDVWQCLFAAGRMEVGTLPGDLLFAECDTWEDYERVRRDLAPHIRRRDGDLIPPP